MWGGATHALGTCRSTSVLFSAGFSRCHGRYAAVASFMTRPGSFHLVEPEGARPLTPCLQ
jgi:hypothetical protein